MSLQGNTKSPLSTNWIDRAIIKHGCRYDYSMVNYINAATKVEIICREHGPFLQLPRKHLAGSNCPKCAVAHSNDYRLVNVADFISRARSVHGNKYDYSLVSYRKITEKVIIVCPDHGPFEQAGSSHLAGHGCPKCRRRSKPQQSQQSRASFDTSWFVARAKQVHGDEYDYCATKYVASTGKVTITCRKHGQFKQTARDHLNGYGCAACGLEKLSRDNARTFEEFKLLATRLHNDKFSYIGEYRNQDTDMAMECQEHGVFFQKPRHHLRGHGCPKCSVSAGQLDIFNEVKALLGGVDVVLNDRSALPDNFEVDVYIPEHKLGIEYHGLYWHSYDRLESRQERYRHHTKAELANNAGVRLIQVFESEWAKQKEIVLSVLRSKLGLTRRVHARALQLQIVPNDVAEDFYNRTHLQGHRQGSLHLALCNSGTPLCMMSFCKHKKYGHELLRYSAELGVTVVGGPGRLLSNFFKMIPDTNLLSYCDRRYSNGNVYKQLGFKSDGVTGPNYFYVDGSSLLSRQKFQKHKLKSKLSTYNDDLSETGNMFMAGYRRIWDAGHLRFIWR